MKPAPFKMFRPTSPEEALDLLARHDGGAKIIAGGQSLVPLMNLRLATPEILIDLGRISSLRGVREEGNDLVIGAMTRQSQILVDPLFKKFAPLICQAAAHIGHVQTRARGTIGGSISHADPAAELPMVMVALKATMVVRSVRGERRVAACGFFESALTTALAGDEVLCEIMVPKAHQAARTSFRELSRRHGDFAIVSAAAQLSDVDGKPTLVGSIGGISETPHACAVLGRLNLGGMAQDHEIEATVTEELDAIELLSDIYASADYRRQIAAVLLGDCLREVLTR
jgi:aerobic carbon-monoxide dehydrogenase medium subunit